MKTKKIALVIAGGVSLGSYEAGVLTELLYALDTLNQAAKDNGSPRYELDVMTGGSAGGITAIIVARIMMYDLAGRRQHLHSAWVEDADIQSFMENIPANAMLSKDFINQLAQKYIVEDTEIPPSNVASFAPDELRLSLSLSNMNGVDYIVPYIWPPEGGFVSTFYSDQTRYFVQKSNLPDETTWKEMADFAIACGNFPIAFQPQNLRRDEVDYPNSKQVLDGGYFPAEMAFVDGGMFVNEPLREAIHLASGADGGAVDPERLFIVIDPNSNQSGHKPEINSQISLPDYVMRLVSMIRGESVALDWMRANRRNVELEWRDTLAKSLVSLVRSVPTEQLGTLDDQITSTAEAIVDEKRSMFGAKRYPVNYLADSLVALKTRQLADMDSLTTDKVKDLYATLIFIVNNVAGLQRKSALRLALIGSDPDKTAGDKLFAFGGFFNQDWREHDYRQGRLEANKILPELLAVEYPQEANSQGQPLDEYTIPPEWAGFPQMGLHDIHPDMRRRVRDTAIAQISKALTPLDINRFYRWVMNLIVKKVLNKNLALKR